MNALEEVVDEFSSESDSEIDKMMIHAVINSIEDSNKSWISLGGSRINTLDSTKENFVQTRRKKSTPIKRPVGPFDRLNDFEANYSISACGHYESKNCSGDKTEPRLEDTKLEVNVTKTSEKLKSKQDTTKTKRKSVLINYKWHCTRCTAILNTMYELKTHYNSAHSQAVAFKCMQCPKVYSRYPSFVRHVKLHSATRAYEQGLEADTEQPELLFSVLADPTPSTASLNGFRCEICHKSFIQKTVLLAHATVHSDSRPHVCNVCGKTFKQFSSLYCHNKNHFPNKSKFQCLVCNKQYATKHTLELHRKIHSDERNFVCDVCGKSFIARGSLDYHILSHSDAKPHVCHCGKGFKTLRLLEKHATLHTGVKPYRCDYCGKQFREKGALKEHTRIHTGVMPYTCEFCGRMFRFKGILTVHRRQHTGERPYGCNDCKKTFTNWANYNKHMKRRHKNEYNPTNVTGRNKYKPPFIIRDKTDSSSEYQPQDNSNPFQSEGTNYKETHNLSKLETEVLEIYQK